MKSVFKTTTLSFQLSYSMAAAPLQRLLLALNPLWVTAFVGGICSRCITFHLFTQNLEFVVVANVRMSIDGVIALGSSFKHFLFKLFPGTGWSHVCSVIGVFLCKALPYFGILFFSWEKGGGPGPSCNTNKGVAKITEKGEPTTFGSNTRISVRDWSMTDSDFDWVLVSPPHGGVCDSRARVI